MFWEKKKKNSRNRWLKKRNRPSGSIMFCDFKSKTQCFLRDFLHLQIFVLIKQDFQRIKPSQKHLYCWSYHNLTTYQCQNKQQRNITYIFVQFCSNESKYKHTFTVVILQIGRVILRVSHTTCPFIRPSSSMS